MDSPWDRYRVQLVTPPGQTYPDKLHPLGRTKRVIHRGCMLIKWNSPNFGSFDKFQFGTSAMVASDFDGLGGYRTLEYEGQVHTEPYNCCFSRIFQASATYGMSVPSLHTESTDSGSKWLVMLSETFIILYGEQK